MTNRNARSPRRWLTAAAVLACALVAHAKSPRVWGADINEGDGPRLVEAAAPHAAPIVAAAEAARPALIAAYVKGPADDHIEALKRFRNPELRALFDALLEHDDWRVRHRAIHALEQYGDPAVLERIWPLLRHEQRRVREKAAIACIRLWDAKRGKAAAGAGPRDAVETLLAAEKDPHVAACLEALLRRIAGKLPVRTVYVEHLEKREDGLLITPFLSGMDKARKVAPNYSRKGSSQGGGGSAAKLPDGPWTTPLLGQGEEVVKGTSLQPFANLRQNGRVYHTGLDVGACMDGAGYYAAAPGVVRFVHSGSDMGTLLVVQHHLGDKRLVNAVYMHGGGVVFVKGGEKVACGQLLGTMGMSYSLENGGHYAHLHYGLYPGSFSATHNFGYRGVPSGLTDWYDPHHYLPVWETISRPLLPLRRRRAAAGDAAKPLLAGRYGQAYAVADPQLRTELEKAVAGASAHAAKVRDLGYPTRALRFLTEHAKSCAGIPGADALAATAKQWKADRAFWTALKGEKRLLATHRKTVKMVGKPADAKALWDALLADCGDTCLAPRIRALITGTGLR